MDSEELALEQERLALERDRVEIENARQKSEARLFLKGRTALQRGIRPVSKTPEAITPLKALLL